MKDVITHVDFDWAAVKCWWDMATGPLQKRGQLETSGLVLGSHVGGGFAALLWGHVTIVSWELSEAQALAPSLALYLGVSEGLVHSPPCSCLDATPVGCQSTLRTGPPKSTRLALSPGLPGVNSIWFAP